MASKNCNQTRSSSASASASSPTRWDVFLSFRGKDTRHTFTDHLYHALLHRTGIRTFRDSPELRSGEVVSRALPSAIQESKTYIVVLSENYASSSWCLDELVEILSCHKRMNRLIIPVFYCIDPFAVRHQIGSFKEALEKHQTRFDKEKVNNWRLALNEVADFSGYPVTQNRSQADVINEVVDRILLEINPKTLDVAKYPIGLDSRVEDIAALFKSNTESVIRIGLHGMGGVGKTTLAKAVFNQNYRKFQGSCFLANVREVSRTEQGLVCLQQQLLGDVLKRKNISFGNVDQGIELIRARIGSGKVLIVIDDLDDPKQLEFLEGTFASGSIIIITTRNEDLLDSVNIKAKYNVNELDDDESRQLFAQHAFGENKIPNKFMEMSKKILQRAGGLPLALKVFGSNLLNQPEEEWRWFIGKLNRVPIDDIEKKLKISFDALKFVDPVLQDIFLDSACFYIGWEIEEVVRIMDTCYPFANRNIKILKKRCLLTINNRNQLAMHDLLRDMGMEIARNNSPDEPGNHSRLWVPEDINTVLKNYKGTEVIQGIYSSNVDYYGPRGASFAAQTFQRMNKLRFLYLNNVNLTGSFEHLFDDLRWLCWMCCPLKCLPSEFYPQKLVTLELPLCNMRTLWDLNMVPHVFKNLKNLDMKYSPNLTTTPDFSNLPCLETLNFVGCEILKEVHISIGCLVRLISLDLRECSSLRSLPDSICNLRALEVLKISYCSSLEALPNNLGKIESLKVLDAGRINVLKLPDSIGCLSKLVELDLNDNSELECLPDTIQNLRALNVLRIDYCQSLEALPIEFGNIASLKELSAEGLTVSELPNTIGRLSNLVELRLSHSKNLVALPNSICNLRALEILDINGCHKLEELPDQLGKNKSLRMLHAGGTTLLKMLPDISQLSNLRNLSLSGGCRLLSIDELPCNLKVLRIIGCMSMKWLPNLSNLKQLEELELTQSSSLTYILGLEKLTSLKALYLRGCNPALLAYTLTKHFFQIFTGFGHRIQIYILPADFPDWIKNSINLKSILSLDFPPDVSQKFLAMIFCLNLFMNSIQINYTVTNTRSDLIRYDSLCIYGSTYESSIVIVPRSIFFRNGDDRIELLLDLNKILGIHLLYNTEITMIGKYDKNRVSLQ